VDYYTQLEREIIVEKAEYNLVATLGLHPYPDGDMWCVLWGEDLQNGVCAFGKTPSEAVSNFNRTVNEPLPQPKDTK
jgi:hypothetical protein